jgi:hypothetical protein
MRDKLKELIDWSASPALSQELVDELLEQSRVRDSEGRRPGEQGYVETYSLNWAAYLVAQRKALIVSQSSTITRFTSEGSTVERTAVDWTAVAQTFARDAAAAAGVVSSGVHVYEVNPLQVAPVRFPHLQGAQTNE